MSYSRRQFLSTSASLTSGLMFGGLVPSCGQKRNRVPVYGHLWVYASKFPPDWDCTPILEQVFHDFKYAGIDGVEMMESLLRNPDILTIASELIEKYQLPISGTSYYADMWLKDEHPRILEDADFVLERLHQLGGHTFGITVGDAGRMKTEDELDAQADMLQQLMKLCSKHEVVPNIHNHTFEVADELHDLKGIISRLPEIKLGPDISWLARAGVDPVWFIRTYGKQMVYLHIRDQTGEQVFTEAVGEGVLDFPAIAAALDEIGFTDEAAIELAYEKPAQRETKENWKISREYVKEVFGW